MKILNILKHSVDILLLWSAYLTYWRKLFLTSLRLSF